MTIATWPEALPEAPLIEGLRQKLPDTVLRSRMDQGPGKLRQRTTAGVERLTVAYLLDIAQFNALKSFYLETLAGGALRFSYTHPVLGGSVTCRFVQPPDIAPLHAGYIRAVLELEVLP